MPSGFISEQGLECRFKVLQLVVATQVDLRGVPLQGCSGEWCDLGRHSPFDVDRQHDTIAVGVMAGKAIGLRGPAVPALA